MRIAFLCKRRYMGKDVILDRYARLYEMPFQLARLGHTVRGYCLDYHTQSAGEWSHDASPGTLTWESHSLGRLRIPTLLSYPARILGSLRAFAPDVVIGASDIPHCALASFVARRLGVADVLDVYDNFESFGQARIPGFVAALRRSVRGATLVLTVGEPLRRFLIERYGAGPVIIVPNGVDTTVFKPIDRAQARRSLGLPADAKLIGTAGGLYREKGIAPLYAAWARIAAARPDVHLVLAGRVETELPIPTGERVHYLGELAYDRVAVLFNALDVGVISILDSPFGRYCVPQKAYEMFACGLPVAAAAIGVMPDILHDMPQTLFRANDPEALAAAVLAQLDHPKRVTVPILDWPRLVTDFEPLLPRARTSRADRGASRP
jgi:glycosyltransferase involved in cell wall biosynthesis